MSVSLCHTTHCPCVCCSGTVPDTPHPGGISQMSTRSIHSLQAARISRCSSILIFLVHVDCQIKLDFFYRSSLNVNGWQIRLHQVLLLFVSDHTLSNSITGKKLQLGIPNHLYFLLKTLCCGQAGAGRSPTQANVQSSGADTRSRCRL